MGHRDRARELADRDTVLQFEEHGLDLIAFEDYADEESPPVRRFRATFRRAP